MRGGYELDDSEFATALAASAHSMELEHQTSSRYQRKVSIQQPSTSAPTQTGSSKIRKPKDDRPSSFLRPTPVFTDQRHKKASRNNADSWEKAQLTKIQKRYGKMHSRIEVWENEKKLKLRHQMERQKSELKVRKSRNWKHYQRKISRIDDLADGAKAQIEEKRKREVSIVKEKAKKIRSTGKMPLNCFCF